MIFVDLEGAYGRLPRDLISSDLDKRSIPRGYINIVKDMYEGVIMSL